MRRILLVFVDANVLFSASYKSHNRFLLLWLIPFLRIVTTSYVAEEVRRNVYRDGHLERFEAIMSRTGLIPDAAVPDVPESIYLPPKDAPVLAAALQARCDYLVTTDLKHFGAYYTRLIDGCTILHPAALIDLLATDAFSHL